MLDYADNPDKTTPQRYLDSDLYDTLKYAANDAKTDRTMFVGGINCSKQNAYGEMVAVQKRFGNRGSVVAYHGIQSFRAGEVTPEMAFEIGKETARRMWGDRYQVLVTVHLNTENVHCHFVVNPVSFQDGSKFQNKIGDHKELRKISDAICREHGLSVLENSDFYKHEKKAYWLHRQGKKTHRDMLREDVEYCLTYAKNWEQFEKQMVSRGYSIDRVRLSVKAANWQRPVRLSSLGYTKEVLRNRFDENFYSNDFRQKWKVLTDEVIDRVADAIIAIQGQENPMIPSIKGQLRACDKGLKKSAESNRGRHFYIHHKGANGRTGTTERGAEHQPDPRPDGAASVYQRGNCKMDQPFQIRQHQRQGLSAGNGRYIFELCVCV